MNKLVKVALSILGGSVILGIISGIAAKKKHKRDVEELRQNTFLARKIFDEQKMINEVNEALKETESMIKSMRTTEDYQDDNLKLRH